MKIVKLINFIRLLHHYNEKIVNRIVIDCNTIVRKEDGLDVLLVTDITKHGEKAIKYFWEFSIIEEHMNEGKLILLRFNLLDIQVRENLE